MAVGDGRGGRTPFGSQRDNDDNLSSSFDQISNNLRSSASQLSKNTGALKSNSGRLDKNTAALLKVAESFSKTVRQFDSAASDHIQGQKKNTDTQAKNTEEALSDMSEIFDKNYKHLDKSLTVAQKLSSTFIGTLEVIGKRFLENMTKAHDTVAAAYKSAFSDVTVKMNYTQKQYSAMFNEVASQIRENNLMTQFSSVDFTEKLQTALSEGLRGDEARRQAYQMMITNKLVPAISTNTTSYRRMSKLFKDSFDQNVVAMSKYTEQLYGGEGLEEGKSAELLEAVETTMRWAESTGRYSEDQLMKALSGLQGVVSAFENAGIDSSGFLSNIQGVMQGDVNSITSMMHYAGVSNQQDLMNKLFTDPVELARSYANANWTKGSDLTILNETTNALSGNLKEAQQISAAMNKGALSFDKIKTEMGKFDYRSEYSKWYTALQSGQFQNKDDQATKWEENTVTSLAVLTSEVPRFKDMASDVKSILKLIAANFIFTGTKNSIGNLGSGKMTSTMFGGLGKGTSPFSGGFKNGMTSLFSKGTRQANAAGGLGSSGATAATTASGVALIGAGVIHGGIDAFNAYQNTEGSVGQKIGNAALGFISGDTSGAVTAGDKVKRVKEKGFIDWKAVGSAATTGGLVGAGVGTLAGAAAGGIGAVPGAVIGGAIGAAAGALSSLATQAIKYADAQKYAKSELGKLSDKIKESQSSYQELLDKDTKYVELVTSINEVNEDLNKSSGAEKTLLEQKLVLMRQELAIQTQMLGTASDYKSTLDETAAAYDKAKSQTELNTSLGALGEKIKDLDLGNVKLEGMTDKELYDALGIDKDQAHELRSKAWKAGYIKDWTSDSEALRALVVDYGSGQGYWGTNVKGSDYDQVKVDGRSAYQAFDKSNIEQTFTDYQDAFTNLSGVAAQSGSTLSSFASAGIEDLNLLQKQVIGAIHPYLSISDKSLNESLGVKGIEDFLMKHGFSEDIAKQYATYVKTNGVATDPRAKGWYKVGIDYVTQDEQPAYLHKGEMVLTASNAAKLRSIGSSGITGLLDKLEAVTKVSAVPQEVGSRTNVAAAIVAAIQNQTESLVSAMGEIVDVITSTRQGSLFNNSSLVSDRMINFEGV